MGLAFNKHPQESIEKPTGFHKMSVCTPLGARTGTAGVGES